MFGKKIQTYIVVFSILFSLFSEIVGKEGKSFLTFSIYGGPQFGGINENRDIDAITSATKAGGRTGLSVELRVKRYFIIETGLEYLFFNQELTYRDAPGNYTGFRKIFFQQLRIPLTYNLHFSKNRRHDPLFILRIGPYLGFLLSEKTEDEGVALPDYTAKHSEGGIVIAGLLCPFTIGQYVSAGVFLDMQRGISMFWEDPHHNKDDGFGTGRTSALSLGLLFKFSNFNKL